MSIDRASWKQKLRGAVLPAVPVPFNARGRMIESAQAAYVRWMAQQNVAGAAVWVHTGRGLLLEQGLRRDVMRSWREGLGPAKLIVAGVGARARSELPGDKQARAFIRDAVAMGEEASTLGADAFLAYAPVAFKDAPDRERRVYEYHKALCAIGKPVILFYLYEAAGGMSYSPALLRRLLALPNVVAIKMATLDSVMTFQNVARLVREEFPDVTLVTGEDRFLGYSLMCGAEAALIGMGAAWTSPQVELVSSWLRGETARFLELNRKVDAFAQATFVAPLEGYIQRMLWALALAGIIPMNAVHDPWGPKLPRAQFMYLKKVLAEIS